MVIDINKESRFSKQLELIDESRLSTLHHEASKRKQEAEMMLRRTKHILTALQIIPSSKNTRIETSKVLFGQSKDRVDVLRYADLCRQFYTAREEALKTNPKMFIVTQKEKKFLRSFKKETRTKVIQSFFLGRGTVDFFIPALGLIIEIDGDVHNNEQKMILDLLKVDLSFHLGVKFISIKNEDLEDYNLSKTVTYLVQNLKDAPRFNSTKRRYLQMSLMIHTLLVNDQRNFLNSLGISYERLNFLSLYGLSKAIDKYPYREKEHRTVKVIL